MQRIAKISSIEELAGKITAIRAGDTTKSIVQCHGVFDLLHIGHIRHFEHAKGLGDILIVTVTPDRFVNKGLYRPAFTEDLRAEAIAALDCVDYVAINNWPTAVETVELLMPDVYVKGSDYRNPELDVTGKISAEEEAVKSKGGRIAFTDDIVFSSSSLINKYLPIFPTEVREYLSGFSEQYRIDEVTRYLKDAHSLKVLVVGETIIDEYQYCEIMGKSAKEPILAARCLSAEKFAGGILAVANHVANFCDDVGLVTMLGAEESQEPFVRESLNKNIENMFIHKANSPTIVKRRFVDSYLLQKVFEVYQMNDEELDREQDQELCDILNDIVHQYDVVIVGDYGHGMLTPDAIDILCNRARFLAVNTQVNAGNKGFNTISRYPRADYICLAHHEIALEERDRRSNLKDMMMSVSQKLDCSRITVTQGKYGSLCYSRDEGFVEIPAFAQQVVDRMGAGDAVLSLTALCVAQQAPMEIVGFIGNVVGGHAVATLGHSSSVERIPLYRNIESLLK